MKDQPVQSPAAKAPTKTMLLGDVLTPSQCRKVREICKKHSDSSAVVAELKQYLNGYKATLEKKGVIPDYLAYAIVHAITIKGKESNVS